MMMLKQMTVCIFTSEGVDSVVLTQGLLVLDTLGTIHCFQSVWDLGYKRVGS